MIEFLISIILTMTLVIIWFNYKLNLEMNCARKNLHTAWSLVDRLMKKCNMTEEEYYYFIKAGGRNEQNYMGEE